MLDLSRPLELDDGTPCVLYEPLSVEGRRVLVQMPKYNRGSEPYDAPWWIRTTDGIIDGLEDQRFYYRVRNVAPAEPEEYEGWFVA